MDKTNPIWQNLQRFANDHKLILEDKGEVGFGRPCVGFLKGSSYLAFNPHVYPDFHPVWPIDDRLCPPRRIVPNAYHKHHCMSVLVHDDHYDAVLEELNQWVMYLENQGELAIACYATGATGMQALLTGLRGYAIRFRDSIGAAE